MFLLTVIFWWCGRGDVVQKLSDRWGQSRSNLLKLGLDLRYDGFLCFTLRGTRLVATSYQGDLGIIPDAVRGNWMETIVRTRRVE